MLLPHLGRTQFGSWLGDGVIEIIPEAYCKTNLKVQQIVWQHHAEICCTEYYPARLSRMISNFISNVSCKQHGTGSKVTKAQFHSILFSLPHEWSEDAALKLLGQRYQTPKKMCMVFSTLQFLRNARLQAIKANCYGRAVSLEME